MAETFITYKHSIAGSEGYNFEITRLLSGTLELSALYSFQFLIKLTKDETASSKKNCQQIMKALLGSRIRVTISAGNTPLQTIHGIIMSIESTTQYARGDNAGWYIWTVRPELAKACYSLNRQVFASAPTVETQEGLGLGANLNRQLQFLPVLIEYFGHQWHTTLTFSDKAREKVPRSIQYRQNDESDYNFLTRLLSSWGLGYAWQFGSQREELYIFDATDAGKDREAAVFSQEKQDDNDQTNTDALPFIEPASLSASLWKLNYGVQDLAAAVAPDIENYNQTSEQTSAPHISLHDETWDQLIEATNRHRPDNIHLSANDNAYSCHGIFAVKSADDVANALQLYPGAKVDWKSSAPLQCATGQPFYITRMRFDAADLTWRATVDGHTPTAQAGLGVLPRPVRVNNRPDLCSEELITCEAWPEPRTRIFLAVVEDSSVYNPGNDSDGKPLAGLLSARNLCHVREIATHTLAPSALKMENTLWVELGSPFADNDSGLLARPRKGNVLVCLDRGDLSIPLAISSLFRDNNATPFAELHTLDRKTRENADSNVTDYSAVTLRNRTRVPARDFMLEKAELRQTELDLNVRDGSTGTDSSTASTRYDVQATRPISVKELAANRLPFNQIQMVSLDNGVQPIEQKDAISNVYLSSAVVETITGMALDMDNSSYVMAGAAKDALNTLNLPITRPHFEGISMYTNSDMLLQSADHQIINAGGEIVVTAAQAITLRVGRSSIRISEDGVEISCPAGLVQNPGAYAPYHSGETGQIVKCSGNMGMALGGSIQVGTSGVTVKGPYVTNFATNMFKASTFLGSSFSVSDYAAKLYAPSTTIVGGAAVVDSVKNIITGGAIKSLILDTSLSETTPSSAYSGPLVDGRKLAAPELSNGTGTAASLLAGGLDLATTLMGHIQNRGASYKNLVSVAGSLLKLAPDTLEEYAVNIHRYAPSLCDKVAPLAGFKALQTRTGIENIASTSLNVFSSATKTANTLTSKLNSKFTSLMQGTMDWQNQKDIYTLIRGIIWPESTMEDKYKETGAKEVKAILDEAQSKNRAGKNQSEFVTTLNAVQIGILYGLIEAVCRLYISDDDHKVTGNTKDVIYEKKITFSGNAASAQNARSVLEENIHRVNYRKDTVIDTTQQVRQNVMAIDAGRRTVTTTCSDEIANIQATVQTIRSSLQEHVGNVRIHTGVEQHN